MKTQNKVQLIGYVGKDPDEIVLPSGTRKVSLRIATHHYKKLEEGKVEWISTWHDVCAYDKFVEIVLNNFSKGSHILVEGSLVYRTGSGKDGIKRNYTEIRGTQFINLDR